MTLLEQLRQYRGKEATDRGVPLFHILTNASMNAIADAVPKTEEELLKIKGIGPTKLLQFGKGILALTADAEAAPKLEVSTPAENPDMQSDEPEHKIFSVGTYLDEVNKILYRTHARVQGEVTSWKAQGSAVYFAIKDTTADALLNGFMWQADFARMGIDVREGMEVIVTGHADIYKPSGRMAFRTQGIELAGEGALKMAYDALKKKLSDEGLFAPERKRVLAAYPQKIGIITSRTGAVIHDFLNNLGPYGYQVSLVDARVEGVLAVQDILRALKRLRTADIDCLVLVRGGGSLESLQAFNNEHVVRALADFPKPTLCAIGHDKDVPLSQMVADYAPSTPTATTIILNESWIHAIHVLTDLERTMVSEYRDALTQRLMLLTRAQQVFMREFSTLRQKCFQVLESVGRHAGVLRSVLDRSAEQITRAGAMLDAYDPLQQLKRGYSIIESTDGRVVKNVRDLHTGDTITLRLSDGKKDAKIL